MTNIIRSVAALGIIAGGFTLTPTTKAHADAGITKGCWFTPPAPPSCATCSDNCNPGQQCCVIIPLIISG